MSSREVLHHRNRPESFRNEAASGPTSREMFASSRQNASGSRSPSYSNCSCGQHVLLPNRPSDHTSVYAIGLSIPRTLSVALMLRSITSWPSGRDSTTSRSSSSSRRQTSSEDAKMITSGARDACVVMGRFSASVSTSDLKKVVTFFGIWFHGTAVIALEESRKSIGLRASQNSTAQSD